MKAAAGPAPGVRSVKGRRSRNEDAAGAFTLPDGRLALVVADGMGGHAAGDVASATALEAVRKALEANPPADDRAAAEAAFRAAADAVTEAAKEAGREGMGTTLVLALVRGDEAWLVHAGDSVAFLVPPGDVIRLGEEHTVARDAVLAGTISEAEALRHPFRRAVSRSLGEGPVDPDARHVTRAEWSGASRATLVLGSDGLHGWVGESELLEIAQRGLPDQELADALVMRALRNGGDDNISAVVVTLGVPSTGRPGKGRLGRREHAVPALGLVALLALVVLAAALVVLGSARLKTRGAVPDRPTPQPPPAAQPVRSPGGG